MLKMTKTARLKALVKPTHENPKFNCVWGTLVGAFISYSKKDVKVELFENVNGQGQQTDEIRLACLDYGREQVLLKRILLFQEPSVLKMALDLQMR